MEQHKRYIENTLYYYQGVIGDWRCNSVSVVRYYNITILSYIMTRSVSVSQSVSQEAELDKVRNGK